MDEVLCKLKRWGCDTDGALERMLGDKELLLKCAEQVAADSTFSELESSLREHNTDTAFEAAHTLKGICETSGLTPLCSAAQKIVEPLRRGKGENLFPAFQELQKKRQELEAILSEYSMEAKQ